MNPDSLQAYYARGDGRIQNEVREKQHDDEIKAHLIPALKFVFSSNDPNLEFNVAKILNPMEDSLKSQQVLACIARHVKLSSEFKNVLEIYKLGLKLDSMEIRDSCLDFIKRNKGKIFKNFEDFKDVCKECPELMFQLVMSSDV